MGYAVFAARKIFLVMRISNLNMKIMQLSQQQQSLADRGTAVQQYFGSMSMAFSNKMQQKMMGYSVGMMNQNGGMYGGSSVFGNPMSGMSFDMYNDPGYMMLNMMAMQGKEQINMAQQAALKEVNEQETFIDQMRKRLETQLAAAQKELESVEKAEEKAIQNSAPKFA